MLTLKLKKKENKIEITPYCEAYTYMFHKLYINFELSEDKGFEKELRERYNLDSWMFQSCKAEVKTKIEQNETVKKNKLERIQSIEESLAEEIFITKKEKRRKFNLINKLQYLRRSINKGVTFGLKSNLRRISYLSNLNDEASKEELKKVKKEYSEKRTLPIFISGEAPQKSNRKFDFDFENKRVIFKPEDKIKIPIDFYCSKGQHEYLLKLQQNIGKQAISVRLNNDYIWIIFDEQKLNNLAFDKNEYFKELKAIPKENKLERKECFVKWVIEHESRIFIGKNINRYMSFDLNPEYIGLCILEKMERGERLVYKEVISFKNLNTRLRLSSVDIKQVSQNNKRKHELYEAWKRVFTIAKRYNVANCVIEDLEFKDKDKTAAKEANRKVRNLWHRTITTNLITKYCNLIGIKIININAAYSSFIGNIKHTYYDPLNAAIEVCRRGIYKYLKGGFYPKLERSDFDTMSAMGLDVQSETISTWAQAFKSFKTAGLRYRRELKDFSEHNLMSIKSNMKIYCF